MRRFRGGSWLERGRIIERSGQVRHQQAEGRAHGLALFDSETRETLGRRRWRQPPLTHPAFALVLVLILHALFALALWHEMQSRPTDPTLVHIDIGQTLVVRLIDHSSTPHAAQPPAPPTLPTQAPPRQVVTRLVRPVTHEPPRRDAMVMQEHPAQPAPAASVAMPSAISLFAKDGSVRLPPTTPGVSATARAGATPTRPADDRRIMQHDSNRMHYKATRFEKYFPPPNETAGGALGRHIGDVIKAIAKSSCDPGKPSTASNLLCGVPPVPPSPKDGDERLNLPPAPLAGDPNPARPLPLSTCIALYKTDQPLPYGCPTNTPELTFKAEMRECIDLYRTGKRLKTWCPADTPRRAAAGTSIPAGSLNAGSH